MATVRREAVKVTLIETHYVETNAVSFKSVVQRLTGKDSCVEWAEESWFSTRPNREELKIAAHKGGAGGGSAISVLSEGGLPCKGVDVPSMEKLNWLWANDQ